VLHLLEKAGDSAVDVDTFLQYNLYPLLVNCLIEGYYYYHKLYLKRHVPYSHDIHYAWIYFLLIVFAFCRDEEISAISLDAIKRLAEIPKGIVSIIFVHMFL
jgi:26S proteasome non-ATPase regulatory subunit 5